MDLAEWGCGSRSEVLFMVRSGDSVRDCQGRTRHWDTPRETCRETARRLGSPEEGSEASGGVRKELAGRAIVPVHD